MTQPTDSTTTEPGKQTPPAPAISSASEGQPHSAAPTFDPDALTSKIVSQLDQIIDRKLQSTKDKRFKALEQLGDSVETISRLKTYLDANGGDVNKAAREMAIDQLISGNPSPENGGTVQQGGEQRMAEAKVTALIDELGLAQDNEVVTKWAEGSYRSEEAAELALRRAHAKAVKQGRPAMPGNAAFTGGGVPSTDREDRKHSLYAEKGRLQMNAHLHAKRLAEIDAELKQLG